MIPTSRPARDELDESEQRTLSAVEETARDVANDSFWSSFDEANLAEILGAVVRAINRLNDSVREAAKLSKIDKDW